ncbi:hypoxanthine phosphoribosyltransferase [Caldisalinibacter kiritimatiensis]|uniref:Hypoxanthine phosphoribosyltransferase n=1 Tax=Caldisalinibacter kiritimatiensis TaxID=1304284 RepID=R1CW79_9FIRM|nr:hypoxanthine phosphoribosyltransferase [Caldisalinibacter kiritimatiensis]EOD00889.1 Hypoxanthine-guanine phosphoribosyltransferase [Caldisalinibacter kiritimatiensis]
MEKKKKVVISKEEINSKVKELGQIISKDYEGKELLIVSLLKGSFIFTADLVRNIDVTTQIEFMTTSSYGNNTETSGKVNIVNDLRVDIKGRDVLIVDDIVDSGLTMNVIVEHLKEMEPNSLKTCVLLDKPERRQVEITPDYVGFTIPDLFIVGYGLNYGDYYRNIPYIFTFED